MNAMDQGLIAAFKGRLEHARVPVSEMFVFGSRARGDASSESDLDLLVVVDRCDPSIRKTVLDAAWEVGFDAGVVLAPFVITHDKFTRPPFSKTMFARNVLKDAIAV